MVTSLLGFRNFCQKCVRVMLILVDNVEYLGQFFLYLWLTIKNGSYKNLTYVRLNGFNSIFPIVFSCVWKQLLRIKKNSVFKVSIQLIIWSRLSMELNFWSIITFQNSDDIHNKKKTHHYKSNTFFIVSLKIQKYI